MSVERSDLVFVGIKLPERQTNLYERFGDDGVDALYSSEVRLIDSPMGGEDQFLGVLLFPAPDSYVGWEKPLSRPLDDGMVPSGNPLTEMALKVMNHALFLFGITDAKPELWAFSSWS